MRGLGEYVAITGESPWWDPLAKSVLWVDIRGQRVLETAFETGRTASFEVHGMPSFAAPMRNGELLCATCDGLLALDRRTGSLRLRLRPEWLTAGMRFNDGTVDPQGRLIIGTMSMDRERCPLNGSLYAIVPDKPAVPLLNGLGIVNGLAFSPDGASLFVADSHPDRRVIWQFDYDGVQPSLGSRRTVADFKAMNRQGVPDGAAVDSEGNYWVAAHGEGKLLRFGRSPRQLEIPCKMASKLAFVGKNLDSAVVTGFDSGLLSLDIGAKGFPLPVLVW